MEMTQAAVKASTVLSYLLHSFLLRIQFSRADSIDAVEDYTQVIEPVASLEFSRVRESTESHTGSLYHCTALAPG